jgi:DNA-binding LacI/PurR family transcriptional regulator
MNTNEKNNFQPSRLSDIAKIAGVSRITVSKALLGTGGTNARMSEATRKRILEIAAAANYRPNMAARMLTGKRSGIIGVLIDSQAPLMWFECIRHMEKAATEKGFRLMIAQQHESVENILEYAMDFAAYGAEGIISFVHGYPELKKQITKFMRVIPNVVYIGKPDLKNAASVEVDIESGINAIIKHLIKQGRKRIGISLVGRGSKVCEHRYTGYVNSIQSSRLEFDENLILIDDAFKTETIGNARRIIDLLVVKNKADAIVAQNDLFAALIINELCRQGYRVPADIAVSGFDDNAFAEVFSPPITTVRQPLELIASEAINLLNEMIIKKSSGRSVTIKPEFIVRKSA